MFTFLWKTACLLVFCRTGDVEWTLLNVDEAEPDQIQFFQGQSYVLLSDYTHGDSPSSHGRAGCQPRERDSLSSF
jgi:hypothetical protein